MHGCTKNSTAAKDFLSGFKSSFLRVASERRQQFVIALRILFTRRGWRWIKYQIR